MGSLPPIDWQRMPNLSWLGNYVWPDGQKVRAEDASNLADALVRGLADEPTLACDLRRIVCLCRESGFEIHAEEDL